MYIVYRQSRGGFTHMLNTVVDDALIVQNLGDNFFLLLSLSAFLPFPSCPAPTRPPNSYWQMPVYGM
jgi:hypothetical protein